MKQTACCFLMLLAATLTVPNSTFAGRILWDDSHDSDGDELSSNFSAFAADMVAAGHTLTELNGVPGAITPAALVGVNSVFLWDAEQALTAGEISTLQNFVAAGGGLFVAWDAGTDLTSNNTLLAPYGLSLSSVTSSASVSGFVAHPITAGITTIEMSFGAVVGATGSAIDLTISNGTDNILSVSAAPQRVVVFGDTGTFNNPGQGSTNINRVDNLKLVLNIASFTTTPEPGTLSLLALAGFLLIGRWRSCWPIGRANFVTCGLPSPMSAAPT
jgi:hypothetical protein